nr:ribonuclease H-like domain-containing protein [Tanacetum cinerariifolium]
DNLGKFEAKGDKGYFIRYSMSSKAFRVFNQRTKRVEKNLHVEFLENKAIEQGTKDAADQEVRKNESCPRYILLLNWAHDALLESTSSKSYEESSSQVPEGSGNHNSTASTFSPSAEQMEKLTVESPIPTVSSPVPTACTKVAANQEVKKDVSSLRYIVLPNWAHDALLESSSSKSHVKSNTQVPEGSGNLNPTASLSNPSADQMETLTMESLISTVSSSVPTACLNDSPEPSSKARLISKRVANQEETPSLDNILSLTNKFEDIVRVTTSSDEAIRVEADVSNMETTISASPTPTLRIYKDHPKSQIIGPMDTSIQTRHKSKEVEEQSFIATIYQKTDPALL